VPRARKGWPNLRYYCGVKETTATKTGVPAPTPPAPPTPAPQRPPLSREELRDVLQIALRAGQLMLEHGANTARVEETIHRLGTALGAEWLEIYVTPSGIIATAVSHGEHRTRIQRVVNSGIDLNRIAAVIDVSRQAAAGQLDREGARAALERIAAQPRLYNVPLTILAVALGCAAFSGLFGGGWLELGATALTAGLAHALRHRLAHTKLNRVMITLLVATVIAGLGMLIARLAGAEPALVVLSAELMLVPGALMVSSVSDLLRGDTIPGMARGAAALLTLTAIGAGIWVALLLSGAQMALAPAQPPPVPAASVLALLATTGFAVLFDVPRRALPLCALIGGLAYAARLTLLQVGVPAEAAIFLGGAVVGGLSLLLAYRVHLPTSIFAIPGFIAMVPGSLAFNAIVSFAGDDYAGGLASLVRAIMLTTALAAGVGVFNLQTRTFPASPAQGGTR
jgi:uncharacterized membrane protein YjjP (DUF1212 family)